MSGRTVHHIQAEIRRRAFERAETLQTAMQCSQQTRFTLDALQAVTGLPQHELEAIAANVRMSFAAEQDVFFSITHQLIGAGAALGMAVLSVWAIVGLV